MRELPKNFVSKDYEEKIYSLWEKSGAFSPVMDKKKQPFTIIMPPPNANDPLHIGHAMFVTVEDVFIRYHRMKNEPTLWLPGTDHAGIETQFVFEKKLKKEGKSRFDFDRNALYQMIWDYVEENSDLTVKQMKGLGASADWTRFKFTLDKDVVGEVLKTFEKLYQDGLVYRGVRLVNYCPHCGTSYSELEIEWKERNDPFIYMKYGPFEIGTVRPETKFRDTALAVNPDDERYKKYIGQTIEIMGLLGPTQMVVVPDPEVESEFGTGIMKVTPAHDAHDFELGEKFSLPVMPIIDFNGRMDFSWFFEKENVGEKYLERAKRYHGKKSSEVRQIMIDDLKEDGLLTKIDESYSHRVAVCYRCHSVLEPMPLPQFFVKTKPLAEKALKSLESGETVIFGAGRDKVLKNWLQGLKDWNISRQIVWGIRIPVWYDLEKNPEMIIGFLDSNHNLIQGKYGELKDKRSFGEIEKGLQFLRSPKDAEFVLSEKKPQGKFLQETDSFDTWFSSGQWPVVTLKTNQPGDFEYFYPTTVMETGYDILPIWVMRMMLLGIYLTGKSPFKQVYLHGLVRDEKRRKMSKSVGNVVNPLEVVDQYGVDALRMALVMGTTPGNDSSVGEGKIRGMRNFTTKIWNAARFVQIYSTKENLASFTSASGDKDFEEKLKSVVLETSSHLDNLRVGQASETVHNEFWHWFCDQAVEDAKRGSLSVGKLVEGLKVFLKLLHPFMPFVTEAIWQEMFSKNNSLLIKEQWPGV